VKNGKWRMKKRKRKGKEEEEMRKRWGEKRRGKEVAYGSRSAVCDNN
jgi:hypothetical protein